MTYLSFIEKLEVLFNTLLDFEFILMFTILLIILTLLYAIKKLSSKKYMLYMTLSFIGIFTISIISNYDILSNTFDDFSTLFFRNIYFPSIYVYISVLVISLIAFVISILNVMLKKVYKVINSIMFVINNVLFIIVLNIIAKSRIDVFSENSLYTNTTLVTILELSMGLCILWILSLITVYITNCVCDRWSHKTVYNKEEVSVKFNPTLEVVDDIVEDKIVTNEVPVITETLEKENQVVVETVSLVSEDQVVETNCNIVAEITKEASNYEDTIVIEDTKKENKFIIPTIKSENVNQKSDNTNVFESILNGGIPVTYYDSKVVNEEHNIINPYVLYENKYNEAKNENILFNNMDITIEKDIMNTSKLSNEKQNVVELENISPLSGGYTAEDYRKISKMLNEIKNRSNGSDINLEDAVAISLINNYSIEDCIKFRKILQSNLNLN